MIAPTRRPAGVTLLVVLIVIGGIGEIIGGVILILGHDNATVIRQSRHDSNFLLTTGIVAVIVGLLYLLVARGLARGNGFSRFLVGLLSVLSLAAGVWAAATQYGHLRTQGIISAIVAFLILLLLYSPKANAFFRTN